ncbi:hypothetical protein H2200_009124 [Cladophialophora chaetospira]|uniref:SnoaL-like domain-containing protein n=1 Tax=Cladophialophora chaetospira TaxID=386627 RepID=A0AA38X3T5_9EURO|nr:hypothetical protein H2200_009124 [Cladophialophora chaetospira]
MRSPVGIASAFFVIGLSCWSSISGSPRHSSKNRHDTSSSTQSTPAALGFMMAEAHPYPHQCVNSTTEDTRAFVESLFTAVALDNFGASFAAALSDDLVWTVSGSSVIAGTYPSKQIYIEKVLTPLRAVLVTLPVPIVEHIFCDGDWATVNWRSEGVYGKNGANYDMQYAWLMRTEVDDEGNRTIVEVTGFYDSIKVNAVFEGYVFNATKV